MGIKKQAGIKMPPESERWNEIIPQLPGEMFMNYKTRLIEHLEEQLKVACEERDQAYNAGWDAHEDAMDGRIDFFLSREHLSEDQKAAVRKIRDHLETLSKPTHVSPEQAEETK